MDEKLRISSRQQGYLRTGKTLDSGWITSRLCFGSSRTQCSILFWPKMIEPAGGRHTVYDRSVRTTSGIYTGLQAHTLDCLRQASHRTYDSPDLKLLRPKSYVVDVTSQPLFKPAHQLALPHQGITSTYFAELNQPQDPSLSQSFRHPPCSRSSSWHSSRARHSQRHTSNDQRQPS